MDSEMQYKGFIINPVTILLKGGTVFELRFLRMKADK